jgi:hypothetical protein
MEINTSLREVCVILGVVGFPVHCGPYRVLGLEPSTTNWDNYDKKQKYQGSSGHGRLLARSAHAIHGGVQCKCRKRGRGLRPAVFEIWCDTGNFDLFRKRLGQYTHQFVESLLRQ